MPMAYTNLLFIISIYHDYPINEARCSVYCVFSFVYSLLFIYLGLFIR